MSTYQISNIAANNGYAYDSVYSGSLTGTITANTTVTLKFKIGPLYLWNYGNVYPLDSNNQNWDVYARDTGESHSGDIPDVSGTYLAIWYRGGGIQKTICPTPIDVTNYSSLVFVRDASSKGQNGYCGLAASSGNVRYINFAVQSSKFSAGAGTSTISVASLKGNYYLLFQGYKGGWCYYSQIYLVP